MTLTDETTFCCFPLHYYSWILTDDHARAQGLFEGMKAYRRQDRAGYTLFRPEENARRMQRGAERMCMPAPSVDQFVHAVKQTVLANRRWVLQYYAATDHLQ
jgi:branched-subunit amino acid aminotransferase/4-amino-4-deoxychorismate lyase